MPTKINLADKVALFDEHWAPRTVGRFNGHDLVVVKVKGEFVWHSHADTDDFFLVLKSRLTIRMRDGDVRLEAGELFVVPVGVEHRRVAQEETNLLIIERSGTPNTGDPETAAPGREVYMRPAIQRSSPILCHLPLRGSIAHLERRETRNRRP